MRVNRQALTAIRESRGWTITALAKAATSSKSHLSQIESGEKFPGPALLTRLADALEVPLAAITSESYPVESLKGRGKAA